MSFPHIFGNTAINVDTDSIAISNWSVIITGTVIAFKKSGFVKMVVVILPGIFENQDGHLGLGVTSGAHFTNGLLLIIINGIAAQIITIRQQTSWNYLFLVEVVTVIQFGFFPVFLCCFLLVILITIKQIQVKLKIIL